ncbi:MAG: hypothetical protein KA340_03555 [Saprospiraceae bacterium]|nr:hypothetical protein [Saprospiraceae bacterium]
MKHSTLNTQHSTLNTQFTFKSKRFSLIIGLMSAMLAFFSSCEQGGGESENSNTRLDPGNSCYEEVVTSTCMEDTAVFILDGIPSFPGCEISLSLVYCFDDFGTLKHVATGNFELISTCQELQDSINAHMLGDTDGELNTFFSDLDEEIYDELVKELFESLGNDLPCGSAITYVTEYIRPSCYAYCLYTADVPTGEGGLDGRNDGGNQQTFWNKSSCDSNGCCIVEYNACYDVAGDSIRVHKIRSGKVVTPLILEQCSSGTPDGLHDPTTIRCLPCDFNCN